MSVKITRKVFMRTALLSVAAFLAGAAAMWRLHSSTNALLVPAPASVVVGGRGPSAISLVGDTDDLVDGPPRYVQTASYGESVRMVVNGVNLNEQQLADLRQYGQPQSGSYWYDPRSGLWGLEGHEPAGYVRPGLNFGSLSPRASNGDTGVFVNGREINRVELSWYQRIFNTPNSGLGRFWLDGVSGNVGYEGNPMPIGNLIRSLQQAQASAGGSRGFVGGGMVGVSSGGCSMVTTDTGYTVESSGC